MSPWMTPWFVALSIAIVTPVLCAFSLLLIQKRQEAYRRRLWIFTTLMANRSSITSVEFVRALNSVEVVFHDNAAVRQRFKLLIEHFASVGWTVGPTTELPSERIRDLLAHLLAWMAKDLDFSFGYEDIRDRTYFAAGDVSQNTELRTLYQVFKQGYEQ